MAADTNLPEAQRQAAFDRVVDLGRIDMAAVLQVVQNPDSDMSTMGGHQSPWQNWGAESTPDFTGAHGFGNVPHPSGCSLGGGGSSGSPAHRICGGASA